MIIDSSFLIDLMDECTRTVAKTDELDRNQLKIPTLVYTGVLMGLDAGISQVGTFEAMVADVTLAP